LAGSADIGQVTVSGASGVSGVALGSGQNLEGGAAFLGLAPQSISLALFLTSTTAADFPNGSAAPGAGVVRTTGPTVSTTIAAQSLTIGTPQNLDLAGDFTAPDISDTQVQLQVQEGSFKGTITMELFNKQAPQTVANFLDYVTSGAYSNTFFNRLVQGFVLQGGYATFSAKGGKTTLTPITTNPPVQSELGISNTADTISMALGDFSDGSTNPNSVTDQFFINLADNSTTLDGNFTVFGQVVGQESLQTLSTLANLPTPFSSIPSKQVPSDFDTSFTDIPLGGYSGTISNFPGDAKQSNFELITGITVINKTESLTYSVVSNSNSKFVSAVIGVPSNPANPAKELLTLTPNAVGTATIVVQATDLFGSTVTQSFMVTVS